MSRMIIVVLKKFFIFLLVWFDAGDVSRMLLLWFWCQIMLCLCQEQINNILVGIEGWFGWSLDGFVGKEVDGWGRLSGCVVLVLHTQFFPSIERSSISSPRLS